MNARRKKKWYHWRTTIIGHRQHSTRRGEKITRPPFWTPDFCVPLFAAFSFGATSKLIYFLELHCTCQGHQKSNRSRNLGATCRMHRKIHGNTQGRRNADAGGFVLAEHFAVPGTNRNFHSTWKGMLDKNQKTSCGMISPDFSSTRS